MFILLPYTRLFVLRRASYAYVRIHRICLPYFALWVLRKARHWCVKKAAYGAMFGLKLQQLYYGCRRYLYSSLCGMENKSHQQYVDNVEMLKVPWLTTPQQDLRHALGFVDWISYKYHSRSQIQSCCCSVNSAYTAFMRSYVNIAFPIYQRF